MKKLSALTLCLFMLISLLPSGAFNAGGEPVITLSGPGEEVGLHTELQEKYLTGPLGDILEYVQGEEELSRPVPVKLSWSVSGGSAEGGYAVALSTSPDMSGARTYVTDAESVEIYNLRPGTGYYWRVSAKVDGNDVASAVSSFTTAELLPNNLYVDGVANVRDCGGWSTVDGGRVRFGMLYRCGALGVGEDNYITEKGIATMHDDFGIKTEIDLRLASQAGYTGQTTSVIGEDVAYRICEMSDITEGESCESIRAVFDLLADESNYPIVYHCAIGTDRTGKIAYLVNGLLGVSEEDLMRDYLFSVFGDIHGGRRYIGDGAEKYRVYIKMYDGATFAEKVYNYLVNEIGVEPEKLDRITDILKEYPESENAPLPVSDGGQFLAMDPDGSYYLTGNITVSGTYRETFTGSIDGRGHTVTVSDMLFTEFQGKAENIALEGSVHAGNGNAGVFAGRIDGAVLKEVRNRASLTLDGTDIPGCSAGGIVGSIEGNSNLLIGCENRGDIVSCGSVGGIAGIVPGNVTIIDTVNRGSVKCVSGLYSCGGLVGAAMGFFSAERCFNYGSVSGDGECTAGIAGDLRTERDEHIMISGCGNYGDIVSNGKYAAGIAGCVYTGLFTGGISYSYNCGNISALSQDAAAAAGICSECGDYTFALTSCYNCGIITARSADADAEQLFRILSEPYGEYCRNNYYLKDLDAPAFSYTEEGTETVFMDEDSVVYGLRGFGVEQIPDGTLCGMLNGTLGTYTQKNGRPSTEGSLSVNGVAKGLVNIAGIFFEFSGTGEYIGRTGITGELPFTDVGGTDYFFLPVIWAVWKNVTAGTSDTTFSPNASCTRGQIVTFLWRAAGSPEPSSKENPFTDVSEKDYYFKAVLWAVGKGITSGTSATTFSPGAVCTRAQAITFLWSFAGRLQTSGVRRVFSDVSPDAYYAAAVDWGVNKGVTSGTSATTFSPDANCVRAQIVTFLYKAYY